MELRDNELILTRKERFELFFLCIGSFFVNLLNHPIITIKCIFSKEDKNLNVWHYI